MPYSDPAKRREASQRHYAKNTAVMKQRAAAHKTASRERNRQYVMAIKNATPCVDCGVQYPYYVMQFDHLGDDKEDAVATMSNSACSIARLDAEIAKCELVCSNCHAERTFQRRTKGLG